MLMSRDKPRLAALMVSLTDGNLTTYDWDMKINARAFTVIELMIAVAIVAIIGAIGYSTFDKMRKTARQQEAKTNLAAVYTAQKSFYARWEMYYGDFRDIGFNPEGRLGYRVRTGASAVGLPGDYDFLGGACTVANACANVIAELWVTSQYCPAVGTCAEIPGRAAVLSHVVNPTLTNFTTGAASNIDGDPDIDEWSIDQDKNVVHRRVD